MRILLRILCVCLLVPASVAVAQDNPFSTFARGMYGSVKTIVLTSAEKMPEENYNFKPADTVRTYGQIIGHLADSQYYFCSLATGEKAPETNFEKTKTTKADLIAALKSAGEYCDKAYSSMTDASGAQKVNFMGGDTPKLGVLMINTSHMMEHYGNLITYMRMKNIVPPTSDPSFMQQMKQQQTKK